MFRPVIQRAPALGRCSFALRPAQRLYHTTQPRAQQLPGENERTTHFGFETVAEAQKEARGTLSLETDTKANG